MADKVNFELVSPERLLMATAADMVVVPGAEGEFGVMAGHAPFISTIRSGVISVHDGAQVTKLFVRGGFADVTPQSLTVLAEEAVALADVNVAELDRRIQDLAEDMNHARDAEARSRAEAAHEAAVALRQAVAEAA